MKTLYTSNFQTEIGIISSYLESDITNSPEISQFENSILLKTKGHLIQLFEFKLSTTWIPTTMSFEDSMGWIWKIDKINNVKEQLFLYCVVANPSQSLISTPSTGEWLNALEIENQSKVLHIGTEDSESFYSRAEVSNCMPKRLIKSSFNHHLYGLSLTDYLDFGFKTTIPPLYIGEQIYFHYLSAIDSIRPSVTYPNEQDISTWFSVEQSKQFLEQQLKINYFR